MRRLDKTTSVAAIDRKLRNSVLEYPQVSKWILNEIDSNYYQVRLLPYNLKF